MASSSSFMRHFANIHLISGALLVSTFVFLAIFGQSLAPYDPLERNDIWRTPDGDFHLPPFAPGEVEEFPLGTDFEGRDIVSRLLWAIRPTFLLVTAVAVTRVALGTVLGLVLGWFEDRPAGRIIAGLTRTAVTLPLLIVAILLLLFMGIDSGGMWPFIIALNITGWAGTAQFVATRVRIVRSELYVEAARAMGGGDLHIIVRHLLPQVRALLAILLSFEMAASLLQIAELGFLRFYLGGGAVRLVADGHSAGFIAVFIPEQPELGQMLSAGWDNFFLAPWMAVWSGTAFTIAILSFMLLGEGLKRLAERREMVVR